MVQGTSRWRIVVAVGAASSYKHRRCDAEALAVGWHFIIRMNPVVEDAINQVCVEASQGFGCLRMCACARIQASLCTHSVVSVPTPAADALAGGDQWTDRSIAEPPQ